MSVVENGADVARARGLADRSGLPWVDLEAAPIDPAAVEAVPLETLAMATALPYAYDGATLKVALADPATRQAIDDVYPGAIEFGVASRTALTHALDFLRQAERHAVALDATASLFADTNGAVEVEGLYLRRAAEAGASDIHFVPCDDGIAVRARVGGRLREVGSIPAAGAAAAITRLKVQARVDVGDHRRAQEGRLTIDSGGRTFDVRLTTIPTVAGEGAALRILERKVHPATLSQIGLSDDLQLRLERILTKRRGALLVCGPTGSGKSTTIYAALADIGTTDLNVVTVDDPVEYRFDGAYQIEVDTHVSLTFDAALRAILRSDPDVVSIGELRDPETATTTLKAALTGSFVLSTLHTVDAPSAVARLLEMGVEPYVVAATVTAVVAQRLARRLCIFCRRRYRPSAAEARELGVATDDLLFQPTGCSRCDRGYLGRVGIQQLMLVDDELRGMILDGASRDAVAQFATAAGMRSLWADGLDKVLAGLTSADELRRALADLA